MKEKLIKDLAVAIPIYKKLEDMYLRAYAIEDKKAMVSLPSMMRPILLLGLWSIGVWITNMVLILPFVFLQSIFNDSTIIYLIYFILAFIVGPSYISKFIGNLRIKRYDKQIDEIQQEINAYLEENECEELYCVPEDCRNYRATSYIYEALKSGRADTLKEAMLQYKQQVQMWTIENKLNQQAQQIERLQNDIGYALSCIK